MPKCTSIHHIHLHVQLHHILPVQPITQSEAVRTVATTSSKLGTYILTVSLIVSELLPFLSDVHPNGLLHGILQEVSFDRIRSRA